MTVQSGMNPMNRPSSATLKMKDPRGNAPLVGGSYQTASDEIQQYIS